MASEKRFADSFSTSAITNSSARLPMGIGRRALLLAVLAAGTSGATSGCKDGPMYALKTVNPYFTMRQWARDEEIGVTDHQRRTELQSLVKTMPNLPPERQEYWSKHLEQIFANDESAEMRRLAVVAAGKSSDPAVLSLIESGLEDDVIKVRMEACRALGNRREDEATILLAETIGKSQNKDVRHAAITALAEHPGQVATNSLKLALEDRDPATQSLVISALRENTGKDFGDDPEVWIAGLEGKDVDEIPRGGFGSYF
ncbi:HEAT repeat domain-containing protein [Allorhodopirellula solitaria]|uniref:HEAT repeat protein n=1 Tax=Allorhodopirellula solitaria TaxID=2527987 RepID=A0A5C5YHL1_9BACT|nr:HEAT repeat domain-containing protein [Allorhodopirellula solitaria]TWT73002.1 HEAT repeat protein [Allorhodopirellula solitaria]